MAEDNEDKYEQRLISVPQLTEAVRTTIGTPFHHGGRVNKVGLDCGGMMIIALNLLGYTLIDKDHYDRGDGLKDMVELLGANNFYQKEADFDECSVCKSSLVRPGDLVLIRTSAIYHHLVYTTEDATIIHSWVTTGVNRVVETVMLPEWWENIHSVWRHKDLPIQGDTWE